MDQERFEQLKSELTAAGVPPAVIIQIITSILEMLFPGNATVLEVSNFVQQVAPLFEGGPASSGSIPAFRVGAYEVGPIPYAPAAG